jgi:hypothetical protein
MGYGLTIALIHLGANVYIELSQKVGWKWRWLSEIIEKCDCVPSE